ncbi:MAG: c-type cytochrome [Burkholderiales bacterium]
MSAHDEHSSFIKTPQQLIVVVVLSFVVPIIGITLLVQLVLNQPTADPAAVEPQAVAQRIQPVGRVEFGASGSSGAALPASGATTTQGAKPTGGSASGSRTGEQIVNAACGACHVAGVAGAPKIGDAAAWAPRIKTGLPAMLAFAIKGQGAMPPRGGLADVTNTELERAIVTMANKSGANLKEPAAPAAGK